MIKLKLNPENKDEKIKEERKSSVPSIKIKKPPARDREGSTPKINLSLKPKSVPRIRVKAARQPGDGYDSEAPDREEDPMIEEAIILRMVPGEHMEFLKQACEEGGGELGNNVTIKFKDSRRAVVSIHGQLFAAKLMDLPTIIEAQKTFDRKNIYKTSDICQMLLVTEPIEHEDDVLTLPSVNDVMLHNNKNYLQSSSSSTVRAVWPHGIAPPLYNVRKRRFRKRISNKVIESVESKVDELFRLDEEANETQYELLNPRDLYSTHLTHPSIVSTPTDADAPIPFNLLAENAETPAEEGEDGLFEELDEEAANLEMELEKAWENNNEEEEDEEDDDEDEEDEEDEEEERRMDEDELEAIHHNRLLREEIAELESTITTKEYDAQSTVNQILRGRLLDVINKLKQELEMKKRQLKEERAEANDGADDEAEGPGEKKNEAEVPAEEGEGEEEEEDEEDDVESLFS